MDETSANQIKQTKMKTPKAFQDAALAGKYGFASQASAEADQSISQAAAAMGRKGGAAKSAAKTAAAVANGKKGGRPNLFKQAQERLAETDVELKKFRPKYSNIGVEHCDVV
jgi:hypothetical protein